MHLQRTLFLFLFACLAAAASSRKISLLGTALIGESCTTGEDCVVPEKSECPEASPRVCKCQEAYVPLTNNTDCLVKRPELDYSCLIDAQCLVADSECGGADEGEKICQCKATHIQPPTNRTTCNLRATLIGGPCNEADNQCASVTDSVCEGTGGARACGCNAATHVEKEDKSKCLPIREFEQSCEESSQCAKIQDADCLPEGDGSKCICKDGFVMSSDRSGCLPKVQDLHQDCTSDSQCQVGNSECAWVGEGDDAKTQCECRASFLESVATPGTCISIVHEVDKPCTEPVQCTAGLGDQAECVGEDEASKQCKCVSGAITFEAHCYKAAGAIGDECQVEAQCQLNLGYGTCQADGKCGCEPGAANTDGKCTRPKIGESCENTEECIGGNSGSSWCNDESKQCECVLGFVAKGDNSGCLVIVQELGHSCEDSLQCTSGAPGAESECAADDKVCRCKGEAVGWSNVCYKKVADFGDACLVDAQCEEALGQLSTCFNDTCACETGTSPSGKMCIRAGGNYIEEPCATNTDCVGGASSSCSNEKTCTCNANFVASSAKDDCLPVSSQIGGACKESQQCTSGVLGEMSECKDLKCACTAEAVNPEGQHKCLKRATRLGDACEVDVQCEANLGPLGVCSAEDKVCACEDAGIASSGLDKCLAKVEEIGGACEDDRQCTVGASTCSEQDSVCTCVDAHVASENKRSCLPIASQLGDPCSEAVQCTFSLGEWTECDATSSKCACGPEGVTDGAGSRCLRKATQIGDSCQIQEQCGFANSSCTTGFKCACDAELITSSDKQKCLGKVEEFGGACEDSAQCQVANTECAAAACKCIAGEYIESQNVKGTCISVTKEVDGPCSENGQCTAGIGEGSECSAESKCKCSEGYIVDNKKCSKKGGDGDGDGSGALISSTSQISTVVILVAMIFSIFS